MEDERKEFYDRLRQAGVSMDTIDRDETKRFIFEIALADRTPRDHKQLTQFILLKIAADSPSLLCDREFLSELGQAHSNVLEGIINQIDPEISNDQNFYLENAGNFHVGYHFLPSSLRTEEFAIKYSDAREKAYEEKQSGMRR